MSIQTKVSNEARNYARKTLKEHKANLKAKKMMEEALRVPYREHDENVGGGSSNLRSNPIEAEAERVWTNEEFLMMVDEVNAVERVLGRVTDETSLKIIEERYFNLETISEGNKRMQSWVKVASLVKGTNEDTCRKIERAIVDRIARELRTR